MPNAYYYYCLEEYRRGNYGRITWFDKHVGEDIRFSKKQIRALELLNDQETKWVGYGGAARGGKSILLCFWIMFSSGLYPGTVWLLGRLELTNLKKTTYKTLIKMFKNFGFIEDEDYSVSWATNTVTFPNGSIILLWDTKLKNKDELGIRYGSLEITGAAVDESNETLLTVLRQIGSRAGSAGNHKYGLSEKVLECFNPDKSHVNVRYWEPFKEGTETDNKKFIQALPSDNPGAEAKSWLAGKERDYENGDMSESDYQRLVKGNFDYGDNPNRLIKRHLAVKCFNNPNVKINFNDKKVTADIAMHGADNFLVGVWYGRVLMEKHSIPLSGGKFIVNFIKTLLIRHKIDESDLAYDADGLGAYLGGEGGYFPRALSFKATQTSKRIKAENYKNLKAICAFYLANAINRMEYWFMCVDDKDEIKQMLSEFAALEGVDIHEDSKPTNINKKEEQKKKLGGLSPDTLDMCIMRESFEIKNRAKKYTGGEVG